MFKRQEKENNAQILVKNDKYVPDLYQKIEDRFTRERLNY